MTEIEPRRRALQASKELRETGAAFDLVREAMVTALLASPMQASADREILYTSISILDQVRTQLLLVVDGGRIEDAIDNMRNAHG